jgi:hypothetical protein
MDKALIVLIFAAILIWIFLRFSDEDKYDTAADQKQGVHPDIIQVIIEKIQKSKPDEYPLETLFINKTGPDEYSARFMFMNTQGYFGSQYDVQAKVFEDGSVNVINMTESAKVDSFDAGFTSYRPDSYRKYDDINANLDSQLKSAIENYKAQQTPEPEPGVLSSKSKAAFEGNIKREEDMRAFLASQPQSAYSTPQGSTVPGPSPARSGEMVAYGAPVFNAA